MVDVPRFISKKVKEDANKTTRWPAVSLWGVFSKLLSPLRLYRRHGKIVGGKRLVAACPMKEHHSHDMFLLSSLGSLFFSFSSLRFCFWIAVVDLLWKAGAITV